jgi:hypothetical protein
MRHHGVLVLRLDGFDVGCGARQRRTRLASVFGSLDALVVVLDPPYTDVLATSA